MSKRRRQGEDVIDQLDALIKKQQPPELDIPVLTDIVTPSQLDLDDVPLLTEEVARGAKQQPAPAPTRAQKPATAEHGIALDVPPAARYVSLGDKASGTPSLPPQTIQLVADAIKHDLAAVIKEQVQKTMAEQLQNLLHGHLDRALSSMLDQFAVNIEEVVRASIADELQKQLAPFKRAKRPE